MMKKLVLSAAAFGAVAVSAPASAVTFATFTQSGSGTNVYFNRNDAANPAVGATFVSTSSSNGTAAGSDVSVFNFTLGESGGEDVTVSALFRLEASTDDAVILSNGALWQMGLDGYFSFTARNAFTYGGTNYAAGTVLTRADFTNASIQANDATGLAASFLSEDGSVQFTSGVLGDINNWNSKAFSISLTGICAPAGSGSTGACNTASVQGLRGTVGVTSLRDFRATAGGSLSAVAGAVPEPATWGLMMLGFGMVGASMRSRRRMAVSA